MVKFGQAGDCEFRLYLPDARSVQLVGDFTGWQERPISMLRSESGWWTTRLSMSPGDYEFQYLVDDVAWLADFAASGVSRNGYGLWVSQLHVPAASVAPAQAIEGKTSEAAAAETSVRKTDALPAAA